MALWKFTKAILEGRPNDLYNRGGQPEQPMNLVSEIETACGRTAERNLLPMRDGDLHETFADVDAIAQELGYSPKTDIRTGVGNFVS